jgi:hypothetical protein
VLPKFVTNKRPNEGLEGGTCSPVEFFLLVHAESLPE